MSDLLSDATTRELIRDLCVGAERRTGEAES